MKEEAVRSRPNRGDPLNANRPTIDGDARAMPLAIMSRIAPAVLARFSNFITLTADFKRLALWDAMVTRYHQLSALG
jgi:hypothetical protein